MNDNRFLNYIVPLVGEIEAFLGRIKAELAEIDSETNECITALSALAIDNLSLCKRVVRQIEIRVAEVNGCLQEGSEASFFKAVELLETPLEIPNDPMHAVLGASTIEPLEPNIWLKYPRRLLDKIHEEIASHQKAQAKLRDTSFLLK